MKPDSSTNVKATTVDESSAATRLWTPANVVTMIRIVLVPIFVAILLSPWPEWLGFPWVDESIKRYFAAAVFVIISCTDWLDGYLARSRNEVTNFGKFMDPLADKILVAAALVALVELDSLPSWVVIIILLREFIVAGVRMLAASEGVVIAASYWGKFKTVFQMIAIVLFTIKDAHMFGTFSDVLSDKMYLLSWAVMIVALVLTIISMLDYIYKARGILGFNQNSQGQAPKAAPKQSKPQADTPAIASSETHEAGASESSESHDAHETESSRLVTDLATRVVKEATDRGMHLATAESLTGGMIATALTSVPGASAVVNGGIVSYVNEVKHDVLGVDDKVLDTQGAVCETVAIEMAIGARRQLDADIAISVTGIAGPGGAEPGKPVGTVWMGVATTKGAHAECFHFEGDRQSVRQQTVAAALDAFMAAME